eukprot:Opistho-1_new@38396
MCGALRSEGFTDIRTFEIILRPYIVKRLAHDKLPVGDNAPAEPPPKGRKRVRDDDGDGERAVGARPYPDVRGHTGYLTFATLEAGAGRSGPSDGAGSAST